MNRLLQALRDARVRGLDFSVPFLSMLKYVFSGYFFFAIAFQIATSAANADVAEAYEKIKPALALVEVYQDAKLVASGTAFCVQSGNGHSLFLTNRHVVNAGNRFFLYFAGVERREYPAIVVRKGEGDLDAALLRVQRDGFSTVTLDSSIPKEGTRIAIAGYPLTQLELNAADLGLTPSVHAGIVNALPGEGFYILFDAQLEGGNSGGPLFDVDNGRVYGIATLKFLPKVSHESNAAISISAAQSFLTNQAVAMVADDGSGAPPPIATVSKSTPISLNASSAACSGTFGDFNSAYITWSSAANQITTGLADLKPLLDDFSSAVNAKDFPRARSVAHQIVYSYQSLQDSLKVLDMQLVPPLDDQVELFKDKDPSFGAILLLIRTDIDAKDRAIGSHISSALASWTKFADLGVYGGPIDYDILKTIPPLARDIDDQIAKARVEANCR